MLMMMMTWAFEERWQIEREMQIMIRTYTQEMKIDVQSTDTQANNGTRCYKWFPFNRLTKNVKMTLNWIKQFIKLIPNDSRPPFAILSFNILLIWRLYDRSHRNERILYLDMWHLGFEAFQFSEHKLMFSMAKNSSKLTNWVKKGGPSHETHSFRTHIASNDDDWVRQMVGNSSMHYQIRT